MNPKDISDGKKDTEYEGSDTGNRGNWDDAGIRVTM